MWFRSFLKGIVRPLTINPAQSAERGAKAKLVLSGLFLGRHAQFYTLVTRLPLPADCLVPDAAAAPAQMTMRGECISCTGLRSSVISGAN